MGERAGAMGPKICPKSTLHPHCIRSVGSVYILRQIKIHTYCTVGKIMGRGGSDLVSPFDLRPNCYGVAGRVSPPQSHNQYSKTAQRKRVKGEREKRAARHSYLLHTFLNIGPSTVCPASADSLARLRRGKGKSNE
jgi:hypothetical protein